MTYLKTILTAALFVGCTSVAMAATTDVPSSASVTSAAKSADAPAAAKEADAPAASKDTDTSSAPAAKRVAHKAHHTHHHVAMSHHKDKTVHPVAAQKEVAPEHHASSDGANWDHSNWWMGTSNSANNKPVNQ